MEDGIKVSVVIPVYNCAPYLRQCLDSVVGQTLKEIEIICVDDGSTDQSPQILQEYADKDNRVRVLTQKNLYAGAARNNGLEHAGGEYIIFWDSDDYFDLDALKLMYDRAISLDADLCVCNAQNFDSQTGNFLAHSYVRKPYPQTDVFNINDCKDRIYTFTSTVTWNKLVRRSFMMEQQIRFQQQQHINDVLASLLILSLAKRICICDKRLIYYRMNRKGSLMESYGEKLDSVMSAYEETGRELKKRGLLEDPQILQSLVDKAVGVYFFTMPYVDSYDQYLAYFDRMTRQDSFLILGRDNINGNKNMQRYLDMKKMSPGDFLFSEYRRLTGQNEEKQQKIGALKREASAEKKAAAANLKAANKETKAAREDLQKTKNECEQLRGQLSQKDKLLSLRSVRAALSVSRFLGRARQK